MKQGDKELIKSSAIIVADEIASSVPGLNIAWKLTKSLLGNGLKIRQQRALEWVEMIRDNPEVFTEELLRTEEVQDAFVYFTEQYITERSEEKRQYIKNVFLGYIKVGDHEDFPFERILITLQQLSNKDSETLKDIEIDKADDENYQIYGPSDKNVDNITNLVQLGILRHHGLGGIGDSFLAPRVSITNFGREFISYVLS